MEVTPTRKRTGRGGIEEGGTVVEKEAQKAESMCLRLESIIHGGLPPSRGIS